MSFSSATLAVWLMETLFNRARSVVQGFLQASIGAVGVMAVAFVTVHTLTGTPEVLATVTPSVASGSLISVIYCAGSARRARRRRQAGAAAIV